ncbi:MAG: CDP-alcohol phosphatidyltransferase family protein [Sedimentisphaerales bacterium]|nr:CDP-alcohol phosphatidyltransferase family protein [Sedimentisphaerales bacterium]
MIFLIMVLCSGHVSNRPYFLDIAFVIFVVAGLTDLIDGAIARRLGVASRFGRIMDPLADKALVCGAFFSFAVIGEPEFFGFSPLTLRIILWLLASILALREVYVTVLRQIAEARGINFAATVSGKLKMFVQSFAIGTVLIKIAHFRAAVWADWFTTIVLVLMLFVTVFSGVKATQRKSWKDAVKYPNGSGLQP